MQNGLFNPRNSTLSAGPAGRIDLARLSRLFSAQRLLLAGVAAAIAYLALVPLSFLFWQTFVENDHLTASAFRDAYGAVGLGTMTVNSLTFALGSTALAIALGTSLAHIVVRTDVPFKSLIFAASLVPLIIPGILHTIVWIFLASPQIGVLNRYVIEPLDGGHPFNVFSLPGMILVEGLHLSPLAFLLMVASFRSMDPAFEESAIVSGARLSAVFFRITLPLARPALLAATLILLVRGLESFEVPTLLGLPNHTWVFTSRIWSVMNALPPDYSQAGAYAMPLLVLTTVGVLWHLRLTGRGAAYQTVTGREFRQRPIRLGIWRVPTTLLVLAYFVVAVVAPLFILAYASTQSFYSPPTRTTLSHMSLENYRSVLHDPMVGHALKNSLVLGVGTATTVMLLTAVASWLVVRTRFRGRGVLDALAFLPLTIPGLVLGVALLSVYLRTPWLPVYGTLWILFIAYLTRYMPYGMRYASSSMFQIGRELEESAKVSGAGWWQTFRRVVLPLLLPGLAAGWLYVVIVSVRELGSSVLLYSPGKEVLSIAIWEQYRNGQLPELAALGVMMVGGLLAVGLAAYRLGLREAR